MRLAIPHLAKPSRFYSGYRVAIEWLSSGYRVAIEWLPMKGNECAPDLAAHPKGSHITSHPITSFFL